MIKKSLTYWYYDRGLRFYFYKFRFSVLGLLFFWFKPKVKFIIFSQGRSGSTLLSDLLDSSPIVKSDGELFGAGMPIRVRFPKCYMYLRMKSFRSDVYGCKIKVYDLEHQHGMNEDQTRKFLRARFAEGWKIIHLRRSNKLRQALSSLVAETTAEYHATSDKPVSEREKIHVNVEELPHRLYWLNRYDQLENEILKGFEPYKVSYEKHLLPAENHQALLDELMAFLNLPTCKAKTSYRRTSADNLKSYIANYDEMVDVLTANNYQEYLSTTPFES
ncbi:MAG: hypothetical protein RLP15_04750 [Cryomorphaceae bacterium]